MHQKMRFQVYMKPPLEMKVRELLTAFVASILRSGHTHIFQWEFLHGANDFNNKYGLNNQIIIDITSDHFKLIQEAMITKFTNLKQQGFVSFWKTSYRTILDSEIIFTEKRITQFPELLKAPSPAKPAHLGPFYHRKSKTFVKKVSTQNSKETIESIKSSTEEFPSNESKETNTKAKEESKPKRYLTAYEAFWLEPNEYKKLREEFEVILV